MKRLGLGYGIAQHGSLLNYHEIIAILNDLTDSDDTVGGDASFVTINFYADDINGEII